MIEDFIEYEAFRPLLEDAVICPECGTGILEPLDHTNYVCDCCNTAYNLPD